MALTLFVLLICALTLLVCKLLKRNKKEETLNIHFRNKPGFSVSDYLERMERIACEQDNTFIPIELWWGCDGWRQKPDGTFQRVTRWKPEAITSNPYHISLALQSANSDIQKLNQQLFRFQVQNMMMQQNQSFINSMCNYSVPMPDYIRNSCINSYVPDLTRCCCDFHSYFD